MQYGWRIFNFQLWKNPLHQVQYGWRIIAKGQFSKDTRHYTVFSSCMISSETCESVTKDSTGPECSIVWHNPKNDTNLKVGTFRGWCETNLAFPLFIVRFAYAFCRWLADEVFGHFSSMDGELGNAVGSDSSGSSDRIPWGLRLPVLQALLVQIAYSLLSERTFKLFQPWCLK